MSRKCLPRNKHRRQYYVEGTFISRQDYSSLLPFPCLLLIKEETICGGREREREIRIHTVFRMDMSLAYTQTFCRQT